MSSFYLSIVAIQPPFDTGTDELERTVISHNYRCKAISPINLEMNIVNLIDSLDLATKGEDLFYGVSTDVTQNASGGSSVVLVIATGGFNSNIPHRGSKLINPTFQVLVYDNDHDAAMAKANAIYTALDGTFNNITISDI